MGITREQVQQRIERLKSFARINHLSLTELKGLKNNSTGFYIEQEEQAIQVTISSQGGIRVIGKPGRLRNLLATWGKKENTRYSQTSDIRQMAEPFLTKEQVAIKEQKIDNEDTTWKFNQGSWTPTEDITYNQLEDKKITWEETLQSVGYETRSTIQLGNSLSSFYTKIYTASKVKDFPQAQAPYYLEVIMPLETQSIYVADFPSLVILLNQLSTIIEATNN